MLPGLGLSAGDVIKLLEVSAKIYSAFRDASKNSPNQVQLLVKEFKRFHGFLGLLAQLLKKYERPLPFGYEDFQKTLEDCQKFLQPYADALIDRKKSVPYVWHTLKFANEKEDVDRLRKQVNGHVQSLNLYIGYLQLEMQLEAEQRVHQPRHLSVIQPILEESALDITRPLELHPRKRLRISRVKSFTALSQADDRSTAVGTDSESEELCQELIRFRQYLKEKDDEAIAKNSEQQSSGALNRLRQEVDIALERAENRVKRVTAEEIAQKAAVLVMKDQVSGDANMLPEPGCGIAITTTGPSTKEPHPVKEWDFGVHSQRSDTRTTRDSAISDTSLLETSSPSDLFNRGNAYGPDVESLSHNPWDRSPTPSARTASISSKLSYASSDRSSENNFQWSNNDIFNITPMTSPPIQPMQVGANVDFATLDVGPAALSWVCVSEDAKIEYRTAKGGGAPSACIINRAFRPDGGLTIHAVLKNGQGAIVQSFPPGRTPIPLPVHNLKNESEVFITFPQGLRGYIKPASIISLQYTLGSENDSKVFQSLLYGQTLLFSRNIRVINSDKYDEECKNQSLRLWESEGILTLVFYTNTRPQSKEKHCWVEEPHIAFERLTDSEVSKKSENLTLRFSKKPKEHAKSKIRFRVKEKEMDQDNQRAKRVSTFSTISSNASSVSSDFSTLNRQGFKRVEIKFKSTQDRKAFVDIWQAHIPPLLDFSS